jgi:outer membrane protein
MFATIGTLSAQKMKFGYIKSDEIITIMPEYKAAKTEIENETKKITTRLQEMQAEAQSKYTEWLENEQLDPASPEKWTSVDKADKETELQNLQTRIQNYQQTAQEGLAKKENDLMTPIYEKFKEAIAAVGKENGLIDVKEKDSMHYYSEESYIDVGPLVKKKLGLE